MGRTVVGWVLGVLAVAAVACESVGELNESNDGSVSGGDSAAVERGSYGASQLGLQSMNMARGQVLYVPVYSHIPERNEDRHYYLTATLSVRNTDLQDSITLNHIDYFDSDGVLLRRHLKSPKKLGPLASTYIVVEESDRAGGVGANFIVEWSAGAAITAPRVESIMVTTQSTQGISFVSSAQVLREW